MTNSNIYIISTILATGQGIRTKIDCNARAWYASLEEAKAAVANDENALRECLFTHVVIEEAPSGMMPLCDNRWLYESTGSGCREIAQQDWPIWFSGLINFGIG